MMSVKSVHLMALLYPGIVNKYVFESIRGEFRKRRREILNKGITTKDLMIKEEERQSG